MKQSISKHHVEELVSAISTLHDVIIKESGGENGIRDEGGLYNSCYKILSFSKKDSKNSFLNTAFIYTELAKRHYFVDGDKRTAHIFAKAFLMSEGFHFSIPYKTAVDFIISIAKDDVSINRIKKWLEDNSVKIKEKDIESYIKKEIENL